LFSIADCPFIYAGSRNNFETIGRSVEAKFLIKIRENQSALKTKLIPPKILLSSHSRQEVVGACHNPQPNKEHKTTQTQNRTDCSKKKTGCTTTNTHIHN